MNEANIVKALQELRKEKKRKFPQTVDLIMNLKNFDVKRENLNLVAEIPHKFKEKKVCGFLTKRSEVIDSVLKQDFKKYQGKELKDLVKKYDYFISVASLMPSVATSFGRVLGPEGKMPSPQLGVLMREDDEAIKEIIEKINKSVKIKSKQPSLKISIGKEDMKDEEIAENVLKVYDAIVNALPKKKEQLKSVLIKFTMSKPIRLQI